MLRGKEKVGHEWQLICTGHNLLKLFGAWREGIVAGEGVKVTASA